MYSDDIWSTPAQVPRLILSYVNVKRYTQLNWNNDAKTK